MQYRTSAPLHSPLRNDGVVYIVGLIFVFLTAVLVAGILLITDIENRNVVRDQWGLTALHLAEAGIDEAIWALKSLYTTTEWTTAGWTTSTTYTKSVSSFTDSTGTVIGDYAVTITSPTSATPTIECTGYSPEKNVDDNRERTVRVAISLSPGNGNTKAAITTNYNTDTLGQLTVDGRNHDLNGTYIGNGTLAIYTTGTYDEGGNSDIGGTNATPTDYAPSQSNYDEDNPNDPPNIVVTGVTWPSPGYPTTPDAVMEYPTGTLKATAQSGTGGSQYVTNPSSLTTPLRGVTYIEKSGTWNAGSFNFTGTGILVVHSTTGNTAVVKTLNSGTFKGLVLVDNIDKIHTTIIGAVFTMAPSPASNCVGNGNGDVLYSAQAVAKAFWTGGSIALTWQER